MSELRPRTRGTARVPGNARHGRLKKSSPWALAFRFLAAALAVVLVSGVSVAAVAVWQLQDNLDVVELVGEAEVATPPTIGAYPGGFNILIVGSDTRADQAGIGGVDEGGELNDVTMLLHVSEDHTSAVAVSIPRDLIVPVPSCPDGQGGSYAAMNAQPINVTLSYGGLPCSVLTVEKLTGLDIQFAGLITFQGVIEMSNAVGGVDVCVTDPIDDPYTGLLIEQAGTVNLQGSQALAFLRSRHGVGDGSDLTRISSQQVYLSSLVRTLKSSETLGNPKRVYDLAQAATQNMKLSNGLAQLDTMAAIAGALKDIPLENIVFAQYPGTTDAGGVYAGKVAPIKAQADQLFAAIKADTPFSLAEVGDGVGSVADPEAPPAPTPSAPTTVATDAPTESPLDATTTAPPTAEPEPVLQGIRGQSASDRTCSVAQ